MRFRLKPRSSATQISANLSGRITLYRPVSLTRGTTETHACRTAAKNTTAEETRKTGKQELTLSRTSAAHTGRMVSEEVIKFRMTRSMLWIADSFVKIGSAKTLSDLYRKAITEQIGIDLLALENGQIPDAPEAELPAYTSKNAEESTQQSLRLSKTTIRTVDSLVENGFAETRSAYIRRAAGQFCKRERERIFAAAEKVNQSYVFDDAHTRRIVREEMQNYHRTAGQYFA